jgi:hypothetical protein
MTTPTRNRFAGRHASGVVGVEIIIVGEPRA